MAAVVVYGWATSEDKSQAVPVAVTGEKRLRRRQLIAGDADERCNARREAGAV